MGYKTGVTFELKDKASVPLRQIAAALDMADKEARKFRRTFADMSRIFGGSRSAMIGFKNALMDGTKKATSFERAMGRAAHTVTQSSNAYWQASRNAHLLGGNIDSASRSAHNLSSNLSAANHQLRTLRGGFKNFGNHNLRVITGGGGASGRGGGQSVSGAAGAMAGARMGGPLGAMVGYVAGSIDPTNLVRNIVHETAEYQHKINAMKLSGMSAAEIEWSQKTAKNIARQFPLTSSNEALQDIREMRSIFGGRIAETGQGAQLSAMLRPILKAASIDVDAMKGDDETLGRAMVRGAEAAGKVGNAKDFKNFVTMQAKGMVMSGGVVTPQAYQQAITYLRGERYGKDEEFMGPVLTYLMQENIGKYGGAGKAGTLFQGLGTMLAGRMPKPLIDDWAKLGMFEGKSPPKKLDTKNIYTYVSTNLKDRNLAISNPFEFMTTRWLPKMLQAEHLTKDQFKALDQTQQKSLIGKHLPGVSNQRTMDVIQQMVMSEDNIRRDIGLWTKLGSIEEMQAQAEKDLSVQTEEIAKQFKSLGVAVGELTQTLGFFKIFSDTVRFAINALQSFTDMLANSEIIKALANPNNPVGTFIREQSDHAKERAKGWGDQAIGIGKWIDHTGAWVLNGFKDPGIPAATAKPPATFGAPSSSASPVNMPGLQGFMNQPYQSAPMPSLGTPTAAPLAIPVGSTPRRNVLVAPPPVYPVPPAVVSGMPVPSAGGSQAMGEAILNGLLDSNYGDRKTNPMTSGNFDFTTPAKKGKPGIISSKKIPGAQVPPPPSMMDASALYAGPAPAGFGAPGAPYSKMKGGRGIVPDAPKLPPSAMGPGPGPVSHNITIHLPNYVGDKHQIASLITDQVSKVLYHSTYMHSISTTKAGGTINTPSLAGSLA